jgi:hypothetical protein
VAIRLKSFSLIILSPIPTNFPFVPGLNGKKNLVLSEWNSSQQCPSTLPLRDLNCGNENRAA